LTQYRRSSRNSVWKIATRLPCRGTGHLSPQFSYAYGLCFPSLGSTQRRQQTPRVPWRPEQVGGLDEPSELAGGNEGHIARTSAPDDNGFLLVYHLIQNAGQVCTEARIRRFNRHRTPCLYCTAFLYGRFAGTTDFHLPNCLPALWPVNGHSPARRIFAVISILSRRLSPVPRPLCFTLVDERVARSPRSNPTVFASGLSPREYKSWLKASQRDR
jgi:hypothetical protein